MASVRRISSLSPGTYILSLTSRCLIHVIGSSAALQFPSSNLIVLRRGAGAFHSPVPCAPMISCTSRSSEYACSMLGFWVELLILGLLRWVGCCNRRGSHIQGSQAFANRFTLSVHYQFEPFSAVQFEAFDKPCSLVREDYTTDV